MAFSFFFEINQKTSKTCSFNLVKRLLQKRESMVCRHFAIVSGVCTMGCLKCPVRICFGYLKATRNGSILSVWRDLLLTALFCPSWFRQSFALRWSALFRHSNCNAPSGSILHLATYVCYAHFVYWLILFWLTVTYVRKLKFNIYWFVLHTFTSCAHWCSIRRFFSVRSELRKFYWCVVIRNLGQLHMSCIGHSSQVLSLIFSSLVKSYATVNICCSICILSSCICYSWVPAYGQNVNKEQAWV